MTSHASTRRHHQRLDAAGFRREVDAIVAERRRYPAEARELHRAAELTALEAEHERLGQEIAAYRERPSTP